MGEDYLFLSRLYGLLYHDAGLQLPLPLVPELGDFPDALPLPWGGFIGLAVRLT